MMVACAEDKLLDSPHVVQANPEHINTAIQDSRSDGLIDDEMSDNPDMIGYDGVTEMGESCRVFIASVWNCAFGNVGEYYIFASVTGNKKYKVSEGSDGDLKDVSISDRHYALTDSTESIYKTLHSLTEVGITLPESDEIWICKDLEKTEQQPNPFNPDRCWGL
jgi:hypothetical protein